MNDNSVYQNSFSGRNPPPFCIPVPIPYLPISVDMCVKLFNIFTPGRNIHMCMDWMARVQQAPIIVLHFDCMRMGQNGVAFLKPEANGGLEQLEGNTNTDNNNNNVNNGGGSPSSPSTTTADPNEPPQEDYDTYDEVTEIKMNFNLV